MSDVSADTLKELSKSETSAGVSPTTNNTPNMVENGAEIKTSTTAPSSLLPQAPITEAVIKGHEARVANQETQVRGAAASTAPGAISSLPILRAGAPTPASDDTTKIQALVMPESGIYKEHMSKAVIDAIASLELQQRGKTQKMSVFLKDEIKKKKHKRGCHCILCDSEATTRAAMALGSAGLAITTISPESDM